MACLEESCRIKSGMTSGKDINALIMKPVAMNELANTMRAVLDNVTVSDH